MPLSAWRNWWRRSTPRSKKLSKKTPFRKCFLEILEDRTLLSTTYTVNLATDSSGSPNGQQNGTNAGDLRYCIQQANNNTSSVSNIVFDSTVFPASGNTTIKLSGGELAISESMNILNPNGPTSILVSGRDGLGGASRIFDVTSSLAVVTITGLTIENGNAQPNYTPLTGNQGGDIFNGGTLTLTNDIVTSGSSMGNIGGPTGKGGAIFNAEGQGNTKLTLDSTIVENSEARGPNGFNGVNGRLVAQAGGGGGQGQGGGIYNDVTAQLILQNNSMFTTITQITGNTALGGDGGNGGNGTTDGKGSTGGTGGAGGLGGFAEGGGIYNAGLLQVNGTNATSIVLADNTAQGGKGGLGGTGAAGQDGPVGGNGGGSGTGGSGGFADGGGIYNTGSAQFPSSFTLQYVNFLGDQAIGGNGNNSNIAGNAGNGTKGAGGVGGQDGNGGAGGNAQGGGIFTAWGSVTVPNVLFGISTTTGLSDQALGGNGGHAQQAGNGGNSAGGVAGGQGTQGGNSGHGGIGGQGGFAKGGAFANLNPGGGNVAFTNTTFDSTVAKAGFGGNGGNAGMGGQGSQANEGSKSTPYSAGLGGIGEPGGNGGAGGAAVGGGIFNAIGSLKILTSTFLSDQALAGFGGNGGTAGIGGQGGTKTSKSVNFSTFQNGGSARTGGAGAVGGNAQGGAFYNLVGAVTVLDSTFKAKSSGGIGNEAIAGSGGSGGTGGHGGQGGDNGATQGNQTGDAAGNAGKGGRAANGGFAEGGAGGNEGGDTSLTGDIFTSNLVQLGTGGTGGNGGTGGDGGNGNGHGNDGMGGSGGDAANGAGFNAFGNGFLGSGFGGAFADTAGNLTVTDSPTFKSSFDDNTVVGGAGGAGGVGGGWGHWGHRGGNSWFFRIGGPPVAGDGGHGGLGAYVYGGALSVSALSQTVQISNTTFTNSTITSGAGGDGGQAGLFSFEGRNAGINGVGGDGGLAQGGAVSISATAAQSATLNNVTIASSSATAGSGGKGKVNFLGSITGGLLANSNGDGSAGGNGGSVQGVGLADVNYNLNSVNSSVVQSINSFAGLDYISSNNNAPPDPQVAAGSTSYLETVSQTIALYDKSTGSLLQSDSLADFWTGQGKLARADATSTFVNPTVIWDEQLQRFIVAEQDVDLTTHVSTFNIAISKSATPATSADWNFFQVNTTENTGNGFAANYDAKNAGSLGWNHDALVFTLNMVNQSGSIDHVQVNSISMSALQTLPSGTVIAQGTNAFQIDHAGANWRPTIMHDSKAGDPMWFVTEGGNNQSINVVEMANVLTATPTFTTTNLVVNSYAQAVAPQQPAGTITTKIDSSIQKVAEQNGLLVAAHTVSDAAGDEDNVQWYAIDVSSGTPTLQQQGDVSGGAGVYDAFPSIDINSQGTIGMTYLQSAKGQFLSMYVTGRISTDSAGAMVTPVRVQAGQQNYSDFTGGSEGDLSGISVDSDGSFWAANEFANTEAKANWGTEISHFNLINGTSSFNGGIGQAGQGGMGGTETVAEPFTFKGGPGGNGGNILGGGIFFSNNTSGNLNFTFTNGSASSNTIKAGGGGQGGNAGGSGHSFINGGAGGNGGSAQGGGIYIIGGTNSVNTTALSTLLLDGNVLAGGSGGVGGQGFNAPGGNGGNADGGGLFNSSSNNTTTSTLSLYASTIAGNQVTSGIGGDAGSGTTPNGGGGGAGGFAGSAYGAGLFNGIPTATSAVNNSTTALTVVNSTVGGGSTNASTPNANANILVGGRGGRGGDAGTPNGVPPQNGGAGGAGGTIEGADLYNASNTTNYFINDTIVDGLANNPGLGGAGGSGAGKGGSNGVTGANGTAEAGGFFAIGGTNEVGNTILDLNSALSGLVQLQSSFAGLHFANSNNSVPPDTQLAVGNTSYIETVGQTVALYNKNTGANLASDTFLDFWATQGKLARAGSAANSIFGNPTVVWDEQIQRFIIAEQDVDLVDHKSTVDIAVSTSATPGTLTSNDWDFYQVGTTENTGNGFTANYDVGSLGSVGWNHDALVFTLNMLNQSAAVDHVQITAVSISALQTLPSGTVLTQGTNAFHTDISKVGGIATKNLRPTVMHDSKAGDPMWFVQEGGDNQSIQLVEMTNVLSTSATFSSSTFLVNLYTQAVQPKQPGGTIPTPIDSSIQKVAEENGLLVAAHTVSNNALNQDIVQWYVIDVSGASPKLQQEGDVSGGANVFDMFPSIDINAQGTVGMTYLQSGTGQFLSMYVTGRLAQDLPGTMAVPVPVQFGVKNYSDNSPTGASLGALSGISVDSDGTFWAANEYANFDATANWGTQIAHFNLQDTPNVVGNFTSLGNNVLGSTFSSTGFSAAKKDLTNISAAQLNIGPLLNNGGTTLTDALLQTGAVQSIDNFAGLDFNSSNDNAPPDPQIAVGTNSYIETVSQTVALYNKSTGARITLDSLSDFWTNQGALARADAGSIFGNPTVVWDEQIQAFIIAEQDVDPVTHVSTFNIAISNSANPPTLTSADWKFFQVNTTENTGTGAPADYDAENPGGLGWNHDALVFTLNMVNQSGAIDHVQVNSISINALQALPSGSAFTPGTNAFQTDTAGANLRPTIMHDSQANDPMWFVEEGGDNQSINVVQMTGVLSATPTFTKTNLAVNAYTQAADPQQPSGTITTKIDSSIQKVAEENGILVAAHTVSDAAGDEDNVQWYAIDVTGATPKLQQQGDVSGGTGVFDAFPSIDINSHGSIGLTYIQSSASQFMSMYVTGRLASADPGTMTTPVLVQAGQKNYSDPNGGTEGALSGISVDSDGSFWAANEFANSEATANWGTEVFQFTLGSVAIDAGGNTLVTNASNPWFNLFGGNPTDQRGTGFPRLDNKTVDAGAFEFNPPVIGTLSTNNTSTNSEPEQGLPFTLIINGTGFATGAKVIWHYEGNAFVAPSTTTLIPSLVSLTQIEVTVPTDLLPDEGTATVTVTVPDGSGISGEILTSNSSVFNITDSGTLTLSNPGDQSDDELDPVKLDPITSTDPGTTFNDLSNGLTGMHTLPPGLTINAATGVISGTIDPRAAGTYQVTINGIDPVTGTIEGSINFKWTVIDSNPPALTTPLTPQKNNEGDVLSAANGNTVTVNNPTSDADPGTFTDVLNGKHTLPPGLTIDANGVISGTIGLRAAGIYNVSITASDNGNVSNPVTFEWDVADTQPPVVNQPSDQTSNEGQTITPVTITAVDADSFTITGLPGGLTYTTANGSAVISGTINKYADGLYKVTVTGIDGTSNGVPSNPVTFNWTVNDTTPPSFTNPGSLTNNEGAVVSINTGPVDADATSITASGLPNGLSIDSTTGVISGTIDPRAAGNYKVVVSATDGANNSGSMTFNWTVNDTTPPVVTQPSDQTNDEGAVIAGLTIQGTDADSFTISGLPGGLTYATTNGNAVISGTINKFADGIYTVQVTATDNGFTSAPVTFKWTVNDKTPPTFSYPGVVNGKVTNNEGDPVDLKAISQDADSFTITGLPTGLSFNAATGEITGTIDSRGAGNYTVNVTAFDGALQSSTSFTWTVNDTTPPVINAPAAPPNNNEGDVVSVQLSTIDADTGSFTDMVNGVHTLPTGLSIDANGLISGTIDKTAVSNGQASQTFAVTITAADGNVIGTTTFNWKVADSNPPTLTNPGPQSSNEGQNVTLAISADDADDANSFSATGLPPGLNINPATGVISGAIDSQAADGSPYSVTVFASDSGNQSSVNFSWKVADTAPPSFTNPGDQTSGEGQTINLATKPVGADPGTIAATGLPPGLSIDATTGVISGTIDPHGAGAYLVTISGSDNGNSASTNFVWRVNDTTAPVLGNPGTQVSNNSTGVSLAIPGIDVDAGTFTAFGLPPGLGINPNNGVISGTVLAGAGTYHVTVTGSDAGQVGSVSFAWVVNQSPISVVITNIQNNYVGLFQVETVTAAVTSPAGITINRGSVTFDVNGEILTAPVINGFATVTFVTPMLSFDMTILMNDFFAHSLDAAFSDPSGIFGSSGATVSEPAMLLDLVLFLQANQLGALASQLAQLQQNQ